ncbi:MAG TPA: hypothetical protein VLE27_03730, partial [Thermoanaerobaculia bacterium]|nr:hypothetical protein [Thermoanaerobaculia bacterium]
QRLTRLRIQIGALIELAKANQDNSQSVLSVFQTIVHQIGGSQPARDAALLEITETRIVAKRWVKGEEL